MQTYQCPNVGSCQLADDQTLIELATGSDTKCSECSTTLKECTPSGPTSITGTNRLKIAVAAGTVTIMAGAAFFMLANQPLQKAATPPLLTTTKSSIASPPTALPPRTDKRAAGASYPDDNIQASQNCAGKAQGQGDGKTAQACLDNVKAQVAVNEAVLHLQNGELEPAQQKLNDALKINPKDNLAHYNLAVLAAFRQQPEQVAQHLQASIDNGFKQIYLIEKDPDLASVIQHPSIRTVLSRALSGQGSVAKQ